MDNNVGEHDAPVKSANGPVDSPGRSHIAPALEAAIGTLREQLTLERERVGMADRRAELAERRADRAEAALAAELTRLDTHRSRLAAAVAEASRLQAERDRAEALAQEMLQTTDALRLADQTRRERNSRLMLFSAILIGSGVGALVSAPWGDPTDGALIGGVGGALLDRLLSLLEGKPAAKP